MPQQLNPIFDPAKSCANPSANPSPRWGDPCFSRSFAASGPGYVSDVHSIARIMADSYWDALTGEINWLTPTGLASGIYILAAATYQSAKVIAAAVLSIVVSRMWPNAENCTNKRGRDAYESLLFIKEASPFIGQPPPAFVAGLEYDQAYQCPIHIPAGGELNAMRLRGFITDTEWEFGHKLNGNCIPWQERVYSTSQTTYSISEVMHMWNLGCITTMELPNWLRSQGVINNKLIDGYKYMYEVVPDLSTCFESMIKNADDPGILDKLGLAEDFDDRFKGNTKLWLQRTGYTEEMLRYKWAAHRPAVEQRVILRMYRGGVIDYEEMIALFRFNGHPRKVAERLSLSIKRAYDPLIAVAHGKMSPVELGRAFEGGVIDNDTYRLLLIDLGIQPENVDNYINTATSRRETKRTHAAMKWIKSSYMRGRIADDDVKPLLLNYQIDPSITDQIVSDWKSEKDNSNKALEIGKLCKLVSQGYMDMSEYLDRATNLNYSPADAALMAQSCAADIIKTRQADQEKAQRKALAAAEKAERKRVTKQRELNALYRKRFPCKESTKPDCPQGVTPPIYPTEAEIYAS